MALQFYIWFQLFSCAQGAIIWKDPLKDASSVNWLKETASEYSTFRYSTSQFCPNGEYCLYFRGNYSAHHIHSTLNYTNISITASISGLAMEPNDFCSIYYSDSTSINWVKAGSWTTTGSTTTFNVQDIKIYLPQTTANNPSVGIKLQSETFKSVSGDADQCYFSDIIMEGISVFTNDPTQSPSFDPSKLPSNAPISSTTRTPTRFPSAAPLNQATSSPISTSISSTLISQTQTNNHTTNLIFVTTTTTTAVISSTINVGDTSANTASMKMGTLILASALFCVVIICGVWLLCYCSKRVNTQKTPQIVKDINEVKEGENDAKVVREWLKSTVGLHQYSDLFIYHGYDALEFVVSIKNENDLIAIGIEKQGHRKHILAAIEALKNDKTRQNQVVQKEDSSDHANDDLWDNQHTTSMNTEGANTSTITPSDDV